MNHYYVNSQAQANGDHEVHKDACRYLPPAYHLVDLGWCGSDQEALVKAKQHYSRADGCAYCCPSIHRR